MNKVNFIKLLICLVVIIVISFTGSLHSQTDGTDEDVLETIGKDDPFEVVRPIKVLKQRILNRQETSVEEFIEPAPELFIETVMLKFLEAVNLQKAVMRLSSTDGRVVSDMETNSLIICDTKENLKKIITEIRKADQTPPQILVEIVIVDVKLDDNTEIGIDWAHRFDPVHSKNFIQNLAGVDPATKGASFNLIQAGISVTVKALQAVKDVEILANPRILVVSGQKALMQTIEEIPYTEVSDSSQAGESALTFTEFKEAGIIISVKATLTDEGQILMVIEVEQSVNAGVDTSLGSTVPIVDKRIANTTLLMQDGQVVVMSGLRKKETTITQSKVPLLGDLPLVGFLFSNDKTEVKQTELLVFISPHVYKYQPLPDDQMKRFNELRDTPLLKLQDKNRPEFELLEDVIPSYKEKTRTEKTGKE